MEDDQAPPARYRLESPNPLFAGLRFGVQFKDGIGFTDSFQMAQAICEPQGAGQKKFFKLIDTQTNKQLFPVVPDAKANQALNDGTTNF